MSVVAPSWRTIAIALLVFGWLAEVALAVIPPPDRTLEAIAQDNRSAGRSRALQLDLSMRIGDDPPVATAELVTHPSGLARLELQGFDGRIDRYLLRGDELLGTKNGEPLSRPRPFLQPFFLLQADSATTLRAALEATGVEPDELGLAMCGDDDCFVFGDPSLSAPLPGSDLGAGGRETSGSADPDRGSRGFRFESGAFFVDGPMARFWVDTKGLELRRLDRDDGTVVRFGPAKRFGRITVPAWFEIQEPDSPWPTRFDVERAVAVNAPPTAFGRNWLMPNAPAAGY